MSDRENPFSSSQQKGHHAGDIPSEQGGERPVREFRETPLHVASREHLVTPNTIEEGFQHQPLTPEEERALEKVRKKQAKKDQLPAKRKRTFKMIGAGVVMSLAAGVGSQVYSSANSGGTPDLNPDTSNSALPNTEPTQEVTPPAPEAQTERAELEPQVPNEAMLLPGYFEPGGDTVANIDRPLLYNNLQKVLDNITYMQETGDFSILSRTFLMDSDGNFPGAQVDVEGIQNQYEINKEQQQTNPDQPVSSIMLADVEDIETAGFGTFNVTAVVDERTYANPTEDTVGSEIETLIRKRFTIQMDEAKVLDPVTGEESEGTERIFVILSQESLGLAK